jgi:N-acetylglucosaminyl-diphospho-decaprenol L-rhamnosyltransferase
MNSLNNLTVIIVTYLTQKKILLECLNSISKEVKIKIIENSENFEFKKEILNKFSNIEIVCTGKNLGYGNGNNFGLKLTQTDFALILNPDLVCDNNFFSNLNSILHKNRDFSIIGCQYMYDRVFMPAGFFDSKKNNLFKKKFKNNEITPLEKVDWVTGCSMLINLKQFNDKKIFDENFFLYFEEFDLCKSIVDKGNNIFTSSDLKIHHLGFQSSLGSNLENLIRANRMREWHWMWSSFYFYKKNYGLFKAYMEMSGKFFRSFFKLIFYSLTFQNIKKDKYLYRFLGILNAMIGNPSSFRGK